MAAASARFSSVIDAAPHRRPTGGQARWSDQVRPTSSFWFSARLPFFQGDARRACSYTTYGPRGQRRTGWVRRWLPRIEYPDRPVARDSGAELGLWTDAHRRAAGADPLHALRGA